MSQQQPFATDICPILVANLIGIRFKENLSPGGIFYQNIGLLASVPRDDFQRTKHFIGTASAPEHRKLQLHFKNIRISTYILWLVFHFHILMEPVPDTFVSINRRNV